MENVILKETFSADFNLEFCRCGKCGIEVAIVCSKSGLIVSGFRFHRIKKSDFGFFRAVKRNCGEGIAKDLIMDYLFTTYPRFSKFYYEFYTWADDKLR